MYDVHTSTWLELGTDLFSCHEVVAIPGRPRVPTRTLASCRLELAILPGFFPLYRLLKCFFLAFCPVHFDGFHYERKSRISSFTLQITAAPPSAAITLIQLYKQEPQKKGKFYGFTLVFVAGKTLQSTSKADCKRQILPMMMIRTISAASAPTAKKYGQDFCRNVSRLDDGAVGTSSNMRQSFE